MTTPSHEGLAAELDALVRNVTGVRILYRSGGVFGQVAAASRKALAADGDADPYVQLSDADGKLTATVAIGTAGDSATNTCRAVHDAIAGHLRDRGFTDVTATVTVTVAHVTA